MSRKRRTWTPEEKAAIVLEILREESTLAEISKKYDIAQPVLSRWKADFIANMSTVFDKKGEEVEKVKQEYEAEKERLIQKIGELTLDIDFLKKSTNRFSK
ncbi:transposase [Tepidibacillus marianensis]|uniref:transposase n=1 Tax=Tepidibacillus marianensis TaxID=3131995 RepID=UPI0030CBE624